MTRILQITAVACVLLFGAARLRSAFRSDEAKIRDLVEQMMADVEDGDVRGFMKGIERDRYRDVSSGYRADVLHQALLYLFFQEKKHLDPTLESLTVTIDVEADPPRAEVRYTANIEEILSNGSRRPWWRLAGAGVLEDGSGGWRFVETSEIDHRRRP